MALIRQLGLKIFGVIALVIGLILLPLPLPLGLPLMVLGTAILISTSKLARHVVRRARERFDRVDTAFGFVEDKVTGQARSVLRKTRRRIRHRRERKVQNRQAALSDEGVAD